VERKLNTLEIKFLYIKNVSYDSNSVNVIDKNVASAGVKWQKQPILMQRLNVHKVARTDAVSHNIPKLIQTIKTK